MASKVLFMLELGVCSIEQPYMVMNLLTSQSIKSQDSCLLSVVDHERKQDQVKMAPTRRSLANM